MQGKIKVLN